MSHLLYFAIRGIMAVIAVISVAWAVIVVIGAVWTVAILLYMDGLARFM